MARDGNYDRQSPRRQPPRRRKKRYRLAHPERLVLLALLLLIIMIVVISCRSRRQDPSENGDSSGSVIEVLPGEGGDQASSGVIKPVGTTGLDGITSQMMGYMSAMLSTNEDNAKWAPSTPQNEAKEYIEEDLSKYRYIVCIDPGHGGTDKGNAVGDVVEKDIVLRVASYAMAYLQSNNDGYYFFQTRDTDITMTEAQRVTKAMAREADLIVSIHINGSEEELGGTIGTYYTYEGDNAKRASESQYLARELMNVTADAFGMWTRGERTEDTLILRGDAVACAVYMGFATYPYDNECLLDTEAQEAAGNAIGEVILRYVNSVAPKETKGEIAQKAAEESAAAESAAANASGAESSGSSQGDSGSEGSSLESSGSEGGGE